ncbi:MAG: alpha/beta fold hydrolase [Candidatus Woesearchaeota archaeon]|nr:alpha/beta fold hydrolase [Candidatus Woesearchaeota archaeon]
MQCHYPIIHVVTKDKLVLHGALFEANTKTIVINIHGTASSFYDEDYKQNMAKELPKHKISFLTANNRGTGVMQYALQGAVKEVFQDCIKDIDAWISFAHTKGYSNIILQGHSLGTEKTVYYAAKGNFPVKGLILLGASDSSGNQKKFLPEDVRKKLDAQTKQFVKQGKAHELLTAHPRPHAGFLPKTAASYASFFGPNSALAKSLPFHTKKLTLYNKLSIPILAVIGGRDIFTAVPVKEAVTLLQKNKHATTHIIQGANHDFEGKEKEVTEIVLKWILKQNTTNNPAKKQLFHHT